MNRIVKFFWHKNEPQLLNIMVAISVLLHIIAVAVMSQYGLAKPGRRIVTIKMVQAEREAVKPTGNKGQSAGSGGGGGEPAKPAQQAAKPAQPAQSAEQAAAARTEAVRRSVSKKGLLGVMGKSEGLNLGRTAGSNFDSAIDRATSGPVGSGGGAGWGSGSGTGDEWAGMGVDTGGFAAAEGSQLAKAAPRVTKLEKSKDTKVQSTEEQKTEDLSNKEVLEIIKRTVESYLGGLRYSYNKLLRKNPDLQGRITVAITINPKGQVEDAKVTESTMNSPEMESEIVAKIKHWNFPAILRKTTTVTYPFVFFPPT